MKLEADSSQSYVTLFTSDSKMWGWGLSVPIYLLYTPNGYKQGPLTLLALPCQHRRGPCGWVILESWFSFRASIFVFTISFLALMFTPYFLVLSLWINSLGSLNIGTCPTAEYYCINILWKNGYVLNIICKKSANFAPRKPIFGNWRDSV